VNPTPAPDQWLSMLSIIFTLVGHAVFVVTFFRALLILEQEFSDDDDMIKDPLSATLNPATDYNGFRAHSWAGFEALWAAAQFRAFYRRYRPLLNYGQAVPCLLSMLFMVITVVFVSYVQNLGPIVQGGIGTIVGFLSSCYFMLIERGKSLKKAAIRLKI
jgi:hypothetical protein